MKKLIVFDVDGTLCKSRKKVDKEMRFLVNRLYDKYKIAIFSGADMMRMKKQIWGKLDFYAYIGEYSAAHIFRCNQMIRDIKFTEEEKGYLKSIIEPYTLHNDMHMELSDYQLSWYMKHPTESSDAERNKADPDTSIRKFLIWDVKTKHDIDDYDLRIGGKTCIDINKKGVSKKTGVDALKKHLKLKTEDILFIGDRCFEGGNDWMENVYDYKQVSGPEETKEIIRGLLK